MTNASVPTTHDEKLAILSGSVREALKPILYPGERVLWAGKPIPRAAWADIMPSTIQSTWAQAILYTLSAGMGLYVLTWMLLIMVVGIGSDIQNGKFSLWGFILTLPILAILLLFAFNLVLLIIFPWLSVRRARHRSYVLTDRQAVTAYETTQGVELECADLADVLAPSITRKRKNGVGDVIFGGYCVRQMTGDGGMDINSTFDTGFTACAEAERVAALFAKARQERIPKRELEDIEEMGRDYQGWLRRKGRL